jgi:hypothetical protein
VSVGGITRFFGSFVLYAMVGLVCLPSAAAPPDQRGRSGAIRGRLIWAGADIPQFKDLQSQGHAERDPQVCAQRRAIPDNALVIDSKTKGIRDAIAYVDNPRGIFLQAEKALIADAPTVTVDQRNCEFVPRVTAMHQGQELIFTSSDRIIHNIHLSPLTNAGLNQLMPPEGRLRVKLLAERRAIPVQCGLHPWMHASIRVFDHPFFAKTGKDGSFEISGVPPGEQNLVVWHERTGYLTEGNSGGMVITVSSDKVSDVGEIRLAPEKIKADP